MCLHIPVITHLHLAATRAERREEGEGWGGEEGCALDYTYVSQDDVPCVRQL